MLRLKSVESLRMSYECSDAQIQINIEIFYRTCINVVKLVAFARLLRQNNSEHYSLYHFLSL